MTFSGIIHTLKLLGVGNGLLYLAGRTLQKISGNKAYIIRYRFVAQPVPEVVPEIPISSATHIGHITPGDPLITDFPRPPAVISRRFANQDRCFVAKNKGEFAGFLWLADGSYEEDEVRCHYILTRPDLSVWDYDVYIAPRFRLGRMFARLWQVANHFMREKGIDWSISRISTFNADSLAAHARLGARSLGGATFIVLGPVQLSILSTAPFLHLSFAANSRPEIFLSPPTQD
ncbi:MAG: GNAT family N-acetyltransferase [Rhodocyclaceae bacterium]|nr:GNAT family N-acetyltransferase [Rhodocyclaceae bacterium]